VLVFDFSPDTSGGFAVTACVGAPAGEATDRCRDYCLNQVLTPERLAALSDTRRVVDERCTVCDMTQPGDRPHLTCLAVFPVHGVKTLEADHREWHLQTVDRLAGQLRDALAAFDLQRRHIRLERSKANINLARNLGHDLTNIIATSKLDIRTVSKVLEKTGTGDAEDDRPRRLLRAAMGGLLNSTRLLQEVVNIYRSFGYINRPRFETVAVNNVLDEIIDVFALSLPARIVVRKNYGEGLPECRLEPRLLKLALFNLLTNAVDAVKANPDPDRPEGVIAVSTSLQQSSGRVCLSVRDNGTGILDQEGRIASQADIDKVFRFGVSTKTAEGGEGLGLNWVWTIVEEFHNGRVQARNHPDGGAEFRLFLSSAEG